MSERHRAAWTLGDQLVSSSTNALLPILVARSVSAYEFGSFAVAFLLYALVVGLVRAVVTDPLLIQHSSDSATQLRVAAGLAAGAALVLGLVAAAGCVLGAILLAGTTAETLLALAVVIPGLLVQDAWRRAFFAASRPSAAMVNDVVWSVLQIGGVLALLRAGDPGVTALLLTWGVAGLVAAALGARQMGSLPRPVQGCRWSWQRRRLGGGLGLDFAVSQGSFSLALIVVSAVAGVGAVGALRAAQVLLAPVQVMLLAVSSFALPMMARAGADRARLARLTQLVTWGACGLAAAYVVPLALLPDSWGARLLGASWAGAEEVLDLLSLQVLLLAVAAGPALALKSLSRVAPLLQVSVVQSSLLMALTTAGAAALGAPGAAAGLLVAHVVGTLLLRRYATEAVLSSRVVGRPAVPSGSATPGWTPRRPPAPRSRTRRPGGPGSA